MRYYIVDAFTDQVFGGNPAAVLILDQWLPDETMQQIATENNLSETAFAVKNGSGYQLRWFTPGDEIDLCGHATLAAGYVILNYYDTEKSEAIFHTKSGQLTVCRKGEHYEMDLPALRPEKYELSEQLIKALGVIPVEVYKKRDLIVLLESEEQVRNLKPDFAMLKSLPEGLAVFVTAPSSNKRYDFVDRAFWPKMCIDEDPVCGSAHCNLAPYWSEKLEKKMLVAHQISKRGGVLYLEDCGNRIKISGCAVLYAVGEISGIERR